MEAEGRGLGIRPLVPDRKKTGLLLAKDFAAFVQLGIAKEVGSGLSTWYRLKPRGESLTNR